MTYCVLRYLMDHVYISLAFGFWRLLLAYIVKYFVSISLVTFWHLSSAHTFHQRLGSFPSLPETVHVLS